MKKNKTVTSAFQKTVGVLLIISMFIVVVVAVRMLWELETSRVSASAECKINEIDYNVVEGEVDCMFPIIKAEDKNWTMCGIPRDVHCNGDLRSFPIMRAIRDGVMD